jgi:hypothetical protein
MSGWIGVDWDGTLVEYHSWMGWNQFGPPLAPMVKRVQKWIFAEGKDVRIMTARVGPVPDDLRRCINTGKIITNRMIVKAIQDYCDKIIGARLPVTCIKDLHMIELWDDRAIQMIPNTGRTLAEEHAAELLALQGGP